MTAAAPTPMGLRAALPCDDELYRGVLDALGPMLERPAEAAAAVSDWLPALGGAA